MPLKNNYMLKEVAGEYMLIPITGGRMDMTKIFNLNEVSAFIYKDLMENRTDGEIADHITKEYCVDYEKAHKDVLAFMEKLKERGIYE